MSDETPEAKHERLYMRALGLRLRTTREERRLTQEEAAQRSGLTADVVSKLENGRYQSPGLRTILRLARGLGATPGELLRNEPPPAASREAQLRARLLALVAQAKPGDLELIIDLARAVLSQRQK